MKSLINVSNVKRASVRARLSSSTRRSILERSPTSVRTVGKASFRVLTSFSIAESTPGRSPIGAMSVERGLNRAQTSFSTREFALEKSPTSVTSVAGASARVPTSFSTSEPTLGRSPTSAVECGKCFSQSSHLRQHMKVHKDRSPGKPGAKALGQRLTWCHLGKLVKEGRQWLETSQSPLSKGHCPALF